MRLRRATGGDGIVGCGYFVYHGEGAGSNPARSQGRSSSGQDITQNDTAVEFIRLFFCTCFNTNFSLKINHPAVAFPPWLRCRPLTFTHRRCSALRKRRQRRANPLDSSAGWSRLPKAVARLLCASKPADLRLAMTKNPLAVCLTFRLKLVSIDRVVELQIKEDKICLP